MDNGQYPITNGLGGPGLTSLNNDNVTNSAYPSWEGLEALMGVTLPRDPVNETGGGPSHTDKYLNYGYLSYNYSFMGCPPGQYYILAYRHEEGDTPASESPGVTRCDNGNQFKVGNGAITVGVSPAG